MRKIVTNTLLFALAFVMAVVIGPSTPEIINYYNDQFGPVFLALVLLTLILGVTIISVLRGRKDAYAQSAFTTILEELGPEKPERESALKALADSGHPQRIVILQQLMTEDEDEHIRTQAAVQLGCIGGPKAEKVLCDGMDTENAKVRLAAAGGIFESKRSLPKTIGLVEQAGPTLGLLGTVLGLMMGFGSLNLAEASIEDAIQNITATMAMACSTTVYGIILGLAAMFVVTFLGRPRPTTEERS